jgi:membrane-associated protease RseP (regulator of RpoE activity)
MAISDLLVFLFVGAIAAYFSVNARSGTRQNVTPNLNLKPISPLAIWLALMLLPVLLVGWSVWMQQSFPPSLLVVATLTWIWLYFSLSSLSNGGVSRSLFSTPSAYAIAELSPALSYTTQPVLEPEAETRLKGCFPWSVFYVKQIEYTQRAIICRGQLRYQAGTNWQRADRNGSQGSQQDRDPGDLSKLLPSEAAYRIIAANIEAEFGDRFWIFFQPEPLINQSLSNDADELETEPIYSFALLPRLQPGTSSLDNVKIARILPIGNHQARVELERSDAANIADVSDSSDTGASDDVTDRRDITDVIATANIATNMTERPRSIFNSIFPFILALTTIATTLAIGMSGSRLNLLNFQNSQSWQTLTLGSGFFYIGGLIAIFLAREITRRQVANRFGISLSVPFAIPFLSGFGTLGVYSLPKSGYLPQRRAAFYLAIAPALAGLAIALPLLIIGLVNSSPTEIITTTNTSAGGIVSYLQTSFAAINLKDSILLAAITQLVTWGRFSEGAIAMHPLALAGWAGLALTAIGLVPIGWLEGGYLVHAMFGQSKAILIAQVARLLLLMLALLAQPWLWIFALSAFVLKTERSPALNEVTELKSWQDNLGLVLLALVLLIVLPVPKLLLPLLSLN